jgi:hypothetical protein
MLKITYPTNPVVRSTFNNTYISKIGTFLGSYPDLNPTLANIICPNGNPLTWEYLVTAPFEELDDLHTKIVRISKNNKKRLAPLTNYSKLQPIIARFFTEQSDVDFATCYYCNIDTIFSFSEIGDFKDGLDFVQRAGIDQLQLVKGIGSKKAAKIIQARNKKQFTTLSDCRVSKAITKSLSKFIRAKTHNHFTLDHFYYKKKHLYLSLCLYNFVPSCFVCNTKFKKTGNPYIGSALNSSPSSDLFSFHDDVQFRIFFHKNDKSVKSVDDFSVDLDVSNNHASHNAYIKLFKIHGRYFYFKKEALRLMELKVKYPDSKIKEMAEKVGVSIDEMKKQIFGQELFDTAFDQTSLVKYKRDIAKNISLIV